MLENIYQQSDDGRQTRHFHYQWQLQNNRSTPSRPWITIDTIQTAILKNYHPNFKNLLFKRKRNPATKFTLAAAFGVLNLEHAIRWAFYISVRYACLNLEPDLVHCSTLSFVTRSVYF